jgi:hypothetical protein
MKRAILILLISFIAQEIYAQTKGLICTNNLRVRTTPNLTGQVIASLNFGDVVYVYEITGRNRTENGIYDLWYKISAEENKWVNAFYVNIFPFYISNAISSNKGVTSYLRILDKFSKNKIDYILCEATSSRNENFELILMREYIDEDYSLPLFDNYTNRVYEFIDDVSKQNGMRFGLNEFTTNEYIFKYGIKIGMKKKEILLILGEPYKNTSEYLHYVAMYHKGNSNVYLYFSNEELAKISLNIEK